jgi:type II secretory pathway component GspD/PulD (secretin)
VDISDLDAPIRTNPDGPRFDAEFDLIPSTKSFRVVPPNLSTSNSSPEANPSQRPGRDAERAILEALQMKSDFSIKKQSLREVVKFFSIQYKIPIAFDDAALTKLDANINEPISLELSGGSLRSALMLILAPRELTYVVENDVLRITRRDNSMIMGTKAGRVSLGDTVLPTPSQRETNPSPKPTTRK